MDPKRPQEFDLEDIIKEFAPEPDLEDILREFGSQSEELPLPEELPEQEPTVEEEPARQPAPQDTIRMEPAGPGEKKEPVSGQTVVFRPVTEPVSEPSAPAEPFSEDWEPEYEEPMGDFPTPEPIRFPENRLRTLRQKLVAGPERRYFALMELGLGKLKWGILLHILLLAISVALAVVYEMGMIPSQRLQPVIFGQLLLGMLAVLTGCYRLLEGIGALLKGRFTLELLLLVGVVVTGVDGLFCLQSGRMPNTPLICLQMLMVQWAAYQRRNTELCQMDTLRKAPDMSALVKMEDFMEGRDGYTTVEGDPDSFLQEQEQPSAPERSLRIFAAVSLLATVVLAVVTGMAQGLPAAIWVSSVVLSICLPATAFISMSRPAALVERRLYRLGAVLCGWSGVKETAGQAAYPLRYSDLLPDGSLKMNGVRFYGTADPGRVVSYTTALLEADGEGLVEAFRQLPRSRNRGEHRVEAFTVYQGGIGGYVDNQQVLLGTAEFMQDMGMELPDVGKVSFAVYAAIEGQVSGVFVLTCQRNRAAAAGLRQLCSERKVLPVLTACDFLLTPKFVRNLLGVNVKRLYMPAREVRQELGKITPDPDAPVVALMTRDGLATRAGALSGARALRSSLRAGAWIHILGGIVGILAVTVLTLVGASHLLTPANLLAYNALWMLPGLMITEWVRY